MTFRVGQKVVCVDASGTVTRGGIEIPDAGELEVDRIYTVSWVGVSPISDKPAIHLKEVSARYATSHLPDWPRIPFRAERFRPVVERKTDISIFTKMLTNKRVNA